MVCVSMVSMVTTQRGMTALGIASQEGHVTVVRLLLEKGTVQETVFMAGEDEEGGAAEHPAAAVTSRQDALTHRCVSSR